jgi:transposase
LGHRKDHRPDLAQVKLMAAAAQPSGHVIACDIHPGNAADDPLYLPLYGRVRALLNQPGLLYVGDCKMAALETRAEMARHQDPYLTPLPLTGLTQDEFPAWVEQGVRPDTDRRLVAIRDGSEILGKGYEFERIRNCDREGMALTWTERVLVFQSASLADSQADALERRLQRAEVALRGLTSPGWGKTRFTAGWELEKAVAAVLAQHQVEGLLEVEWIRQETSRKRYVGRGRGGPNRAQRTEWTVRYQITMVRRNESVIQERKARLGWRVLVTNAPKTRLPLTQAVLVYREGVCLERDFHLLKDRPLGISPLYVRRGDPIQGLTHLLTLALRILTLFELVVRRGQSQSGEKLKGLYPGQADRTTDRPTGIRVLAAIADLEITLTRVESEGTHHWHLPPLPELLVKVLGYLGLPETVYTRLVNNSS